MNIMCTLCYFIAFPKDQTGQKSGSHLCTMRHRMMLGDSWPGHSGNGLEVSVSQGGNWETARMEQHYWSWLFSHYVSNLLLLWKASRCLLSPSAGSTLVLWIITPFAQPFWEQHRVEDVHIGELPSLVSVLNSILWSQPLGLLSVQIKLQTHLWMLCLCAVKSWA